MMLLALALAAAAAVLGAAAADDFHVSNVFGSHMALQRNAPIRIWGFGATGCASVTGSLGSARAAGVPGADGVWQLVFPALPASFTPTTFTAACGSATITLTDILVGDVVLCSGNMEFTTIDTDGGPAEVQAANNYPFIRITSGPLQGKAHLPAYPTAPASELTAVDLAWAVASNVTVNGGVPNQWDYFSAACWLTLRHTADLNQAAGQPVPLGGIVQCYGGTSIQWWSSPQALAQCPAAPGSACCGYGGFSSCLYNGQIAPLIGNASFGPLGLSAVLWYQGEQNANCGGPPQIAFYSCALPALVADWRASFASPALPFGVFLLAPWQQGGDPTDPSFPQLRLTQVNASLRLPGVFTASTLDSGDPNGGPVHSPFKSVPASRAAAALQSLLYKRPAYTASPRYASGVAGKSAGILTAVITFAGPTAAPAPLSLALNTSVACPPSLHPLSCDSFAVLVAPSCVWVSATHNASILAASLHTRTSILLTLQASAVPADAEIVATRGYYANWPLAQLTDANSGFPADPWLEEMPGTAGGPCAWAVARAATEKD